MYEGKNIHYSTVDQKPLCSFSGKVCNQRRLNKYGFCVRHILEDPEAPFKRCAYVAKSSKQTCTQPIPRNEERQYCNNHMQVLGMLPKKKRKPKKDKILQAPVFANQLEHKELFQSQIRARLSADAAKTQIVSVKNVGSRDDVVEDVYAFPTDPGEGAGKVNVSTILASVGMTDPLQSAGAGKSVNYIPQRSSCDSGSSGSSSLAKIYPELAEKLEKIKPKIETKVKGKVKSSRTMNSLQTKIAQNKIKDKLKRNHESSASSQSQSPSSSFNSANSPGFHLNISSPSVQVESPSHTSVSETKGVSLTEEIGAKEKVTPSSTSVTTDSVHLSTPSVNSLPALTQLNALGFPSLNLNMGPFGLPLPTASDVEETLKQLAKVTPFPIEGALLPPEGAAGLLPRFPLGGLPAGAFIPTADLLTLHHLLRPPLAHQSGPPPPYPGTQSRTSLTYGATSLPAVNVTTPLPAREQRVANQTKSVTTEQSKQYTHIETPKPVITSVSGNISSFATHSTSAVPVKSTESVKSSATLPLPLPPTPSTAKPSKARTQRSKVSPVSKSRTPMALLSVPVTLTRTRKLKNVLLETDLKKIKTESAIKYYRTHKKRKIDNHNLLVSEFGSSDSDSSDCDILPWQPDWFAASSDEDQGDDEEEDQSFDLRTTKLALSRARLRRQCFQSKKSFCANSNVRDLDTKSVSALIASARENPRVAVQTIYEVTGNRPKPVNKFKRRGLEKRKCCYKNDDDVRCQNVIVPYTNHCIKHVMYNVDQQLFEYCTAKFADNTQCCVPVIDLKHELPLCMEHGIKADNYQKLQDTEPKPKRPRKKTKPSALTRPPKKGKKKRNQKKVTRPQKPLPPELPTGDTEMPDTEEEIASPSHDDDDDEDGDKTEDEDDSTQKAMPSKMAILKTTPSVPPKVQLAEPQVKRVSPPKVQDKLQKTSSLEELENLGGLPELENEKMFGELPLETASKLLEENDFQEVLNRLPDETFDLFTNKNGMFEPTTEEVEELEKSIAMANKDFKYAKDSLEQISSSHAPLPPILDEADELTKQIAEEILSQNLGSAISSQSINTADAQESIKAIARSLSTSGQFLAPQNSNPLDFDNQGLINSLQRQPSSVSVVSPETQSLTQQTFLRKDSAPNVSVSTQSSSSHQFTQYSHTLAHQSSAAISSQPNSNMLLTNTVPVKPSHVSVASTLPVGSSASVKNLEGGSVLQTGGRILTSVPNVENSSLRSNIPLAQQQLLQLMSMRQQAPLQFHTVPTASPRPPVQLPQVPPLQLTQQLTAEQLLEKQRIIQQQKQHLEAQQQQLLRQQQQLEALTQHKQQLESLTQQQQVDPQLLQQHILKHTDLVDTGNGGRGSGVTPLPPPPLPVSTKSVEQQSVPQQRTVTQPAAVSSTVTDKSATQATVLPTLPQYVSSVSQLPVPMLSQEAKTTAVLPTAQLLELQQQLALFAQHQQLQQLQQQMSNISQQNLTNLSQQGVSNVNLQNLSSLNQQNSLNLDRQAVTNLNLQSVSNLGQQSVSNLNSQSVSSLSQQSVSNINLSNLNQQNVTNLNPQNVSNLTNDRNAGILIHGQTSAIISTQPSQAQSKIRTFADTHSFLPSNKQVASHVPTLQETQHRSVASSKQQTTNVQYLPPKQGVASGKMQVPVSEKSVPQKQTRKQTVSTKTSALGSEKLSQTSVSQSPIVTSESSLLAKIDTKTMTTKALEQHIVQMAYQQALAKQTEEDLERSKNPKKTSSKKNSKGSKRNSSAKKTKEVVKTPEMLRRQSELEEQLAQLAKQNMAQKHVIQQKSFMKQLASQPSTAADMFKHVSVPTTTIAWKPIPSVGQTCPNGIPEDSVSKTTPLPVGTLAHSGASNTVNLSSTINLSLTTTSQLTARPITKHLGPPPSYHHTMTAALTKSNSAPS